MKIKTRITYPEYKRIMLLLSFRKPRVIFFLIIIVLIIINALFRSMNNRQYIFLALFLAYTVFVIFRMRGAIKKSYDSNLRLQGEIEYDITSDKMKITGTSFNSELDWSTTYKIEELKNWFLVYGSAQTANLIPKKDMTDDEINTLREIFRNLHTVKIKKLR